MAPEELVETIGDLLKRYRAVYAEMFREDSLFAAAKERRDQAHQRERKAFLAIHDCVFPGFRRTFDIGTSSAVVCCNKEGELTIDFFTRGDPDAVPAEIKHKIP